MAGISPTSDRAQHPMIRRSPGLAEVRMYALDGLTLLPFPLPSTATRTLWGCIADIGRGVFGPSTLNPLGARRGVARGK